MKRLRYIFILGLCLSPLHAYEFEGGIQTGMGRTVILSQPTATQFLTCPGAAFESDRFLFESGWQRRFELKDLDEVYFAAAYRHHAWTGAIGFSQLGRSNYYTEKVIRAAGAYRFRDYSLAAIFSGKIVEIEGFSRLRAGSAGIATGWHRGLYHLGVAIDNINRPKLAEHLESENVTYDIFAEIAHPGSFAVTGRATFEKNEEPRLSLGQRFRLPGGHALFWGIAQNPLTYGGGLNAAFRRMSLAYAVNYHPVLGFTHNISFNFAAGRTK